jgi:anti-anti-sigma factor
MTNDAHGRIESVQLEDSLWLVALHGEHDLSTVAQFDATRAEIAASGTTVVVDLSATRFIDSSVIGWLVALQQSGERVLLVRPREQIVIRALELLGLADQFPSFETQEAALVAAKEEPCP